MIASLFGEVIDQTARTAVIDVNGVGYEVHCSASTLDSLEIGSKVRILTYTDMAEGRIKLFGFGDKPEREIFLLLIQVNTIGPRTALEILSSIDRSSLLRAIGTGDSEQLKAVKGIGKKTADRIILELRDKIGGVGSAIERENYPSVGSNGTQGEAVAGLQALGFPAKQAEQLVSTVVAMRNGVSDDTAAIITAALKLV